MHMKCSVYKNARKRKQLHNFCAFLSLDYDKEVLRSLHSGSIGVRTKIVLAAFGIVLLN